MAATLSTGAPPARSGSIWPWSRRTDTFNQPTDGLANELGQAHVRFAICCFMAVYFYLIGFSNHPLYLGFSLYCLSYLAILRRAHTWSSARVVLALLLDNYFTVGGLYVTGSKGVFLYIFLIHISFGYGVRYGRTYLWMSVSAACAGVVTLYLASPHWRGNVHAMIAYFFGVPFIALYIDYFVQRLRRAQREADARTTEVTRLLAFVAHDIRTPLQSLLSTIEMTRAGSLEQGTRLRLGRMEQAVQVLARMATEVLGSARTPLATQPTPSLATFAWLIGVVDIFRDEFTRQRIELRYAFDFTIPPRIHLDRLAAERLLLNALSNAARHAAAGEISLQMHMQSGPGSDARLVFTIANRAADDQHKSSSTAGSGQSTLYGAGLGLAGAQATAASAHGEFRFETLADNTHRSHFSIPFVAADTAGAGPPIVLPVIVVSANNAPLSTLLAALTGTARCIDFASIEYLQKHAATLKPRIAAIFVAEDQLRTPATTPSLATLHEDLGTFTVFGCTTDTAELPLPTGALNRMTVDSPPEAYLNAVYAQTALRNIDCAIALADGGWRKHLAHRRILLVEDNAVNAEVLAEGLREFIGELQVAHTIAAARAVLGRDLFDVVLLDWHLSDGCADALIDELAVLADERRTRTIVLSAESPSVIQQALAGRYPCPIVQRPAPIARIVEAIVQVLHVPAVEQSGRELHANAIFAAEIYEDLLTATADNARVDALIFRAVQDLDALVSRLDGSIPMSVAEPAPLKHRLHDLKSVADAIGAHELGNGVQRIIDTSAGQPEPTLGPADLALLQGLWRLTQDHIVVYRLALAERRQTLAG